MYARGDRPREWARCLQTSPSIFSAAYFRGGSLLQELFMRKFLLVIGLTSLALTGCKVKVPEQNKPHCTAVAASASVDADTAVDVTITATGGEAPYYLQGQVGTFTSTTTISRSYSNDSGADKYIEEQVLVNDNVGLTAQCSFQVTVHTKVTTPVASVDVTASPSASVLVGSSITLQATSTNLGASPTYTFAFTQAGVNKVQTGAQAVFSVTDSAAHDFDVVVTGSGNSLTATKTIHLSFTVAAPGSMACTIAHDKSYAVVDEEVKFTISASTGEAITILEFLPGTSGTVASTVDGVVKVKYSSVGTKTVSVRAKAKNRNVICNNNISMVDSVAIKKALTCVAKTDLTQYRVYYGPSAPAWDGYLWNSALVWAEVPSDAGVGSASVTAINTTPDINGFYQPYQNNPIAKEVYFYEAGTTKLELTVKDSVGNTVKCTTGDIQIYY